MGSKPIRSRALSIKEKNPEISVGKKKNFQLEKSCSIWSKTLARCGADHGPGTGTDYEKRVKLIEHKIPFGNSTRENGPTFLDFPLFLGIFQWDEPTKRVPFTAEPEIPEILTSKWKVPQMLQFQQHLLRVFFSTK